MASSSKVQPRGVTLIELAVVIALIGIVAALAVYSVVRLRPRATLEGVTSDLTAMIHGARQSALADGHDVIVMLFPSRTGKGPRAVVYTDVASNFMTGGGALSFDNVSADTGLGDAIEIPAEIAFGPSTGMGSSAVLAAPLGAIDVKKACSFCSTDSSKNLRGAIRFDTRGSATFYSATAAKRPDGNGASFTLTNPAMGTARNTFVILSSTGAVQVVRSQ